jgi:hypothetical protein
MSLLRVRPPKAVHLEECRQLRIPYGLATFVVRGLTSSASFTSRAVRVCWANSARAHSEKQAAMSLSTEEP